MRGTPMFPPNFAFSKSALVMIAFVSVSPCILIDTKLAPFRFTLGPTIYPLVVIL